MTDRDTEALFAREQAEARKDPSALLPGPWDDALWRCHVCGQPEGKSHVGQGCADGGTVVDCRVAKRKFAHVAPRRFYVQMTRDQIIEEMSTKRFSVRQVFYNTLAHCADRQSFTVKWPHALSVISVDEWNTCREVALDYERREFGKAAGERSDG